MSYFGNDMDGCFKIIGALAVAGFLALLVGVAWGINWLWHHLRFV